MTATYVVLGMGKSGTTLVSQTLHQSGIPMVESERTEQSYSEGNHYERTSTKVINYMLLDCEDDHSLDVELRQVDSAGNDLKKRAGTVINHLSSRHKAWGFKDPRTTLTYPFWRELLPPHGLICVYRHPEEVWRHYSRGGRWDRGVRQVPKCLSHWVFYNRCILDYLAQPDQHAILVRYETFVEDDSELDRLSGFVGHELEDARIREARREKRRWYPSGYTVGKMLYNARRDKFGVRTEARTILETLESLRGGVAQDL